MNTPRGIPLLSGFPPDNRTPETSCRKCDREFNIFHRSRKCNHCGYSYCSSCSNFSALLPRETGYDPVAVCAYCIEYLTITASSKNYLRALPLGKLKKYLDAYHIRADRAVEKDDLVEIILTARGPNGCLPHANEDYYRKHSVPTGSTNRSRNHRHTRQEHPQPSPRPRQQSSQDFPRPDLEPQREPPPTPPRYFHSSSTSTAPRPQPAYDTRPHTQYRPPPSAPHPQQRPPHPQQRPAPRPSASSFPNMPTPNAQTRPRTTSASPSAPPSLDRLLEMSPEDISSFPISMLKAILFQNHVNARLLIEKTDLVEKVETLINEERRQRHLNAMFAEQEEAAERERVQEILNRIERNYYGIGHEDTDSDHVMSDAVETLETLASSVVDVPIVDAAGDVPSPDEDSARPPATPPKSGQPPTRAVAPSTLDRIGLCVICQDDEANIAIVDCGHMAMCRSCSDLVMSSTRECPLCRTRIITEARLLRIFKA